ncbi:MAG TPA: tetratricopeptide repeat protein [Vicinamibacterales bacterium]|nr:tetratricopeptide repeat protein [Vicinamibacterales bacterium]
MAGVAVVAIGLFIVTRGPSPTPVPKADPTVITGESPRIQGEVRQPDPAETAKHAAVDAIRSGGAAYATGDLISAQTQFEAAVIAAPDDAEARNNLAQVLVRQGKTAQAMPHYDVAVKIAPDKWSYRFNRARAYSQLERWADAAVEYEVATRLFPDDFATHYNLGLALIRLRRYSDAVGWLEKAVAAAPEEHGFLIQLGTAHIGAGQPDRARVAFEQFLSRAPNDAEAPRVKALLEALAAAPSK